MTGDRPGRKCGGSDDDAWRNHGRLDQLLPRTASRTCSGRPSCVIGGSSGIGLETARLARAQGADIILTARNPDRLHRAGLELGASIAAFDATDFGRLGRFFDALPAPIDHVLVTGPGPYYAPLAEFDLDAARRDVDAHLLLPLQVATERREQGSPGRHPALHGRRRRPSCGTGLAFIAALTAALPAMTKNLALEVAPVRVNLIAAGFVDTPLSATLPGGEIDARREHSAPRCRSGASSARPTSPPWPSTS